MRRLKHLIGIAALPVLAPWAFAGDEPEFGEPTTLFVSHCISHFVTPGYSIADNLTGEKGVFELPEKRASNFLDGAKGRAWAFKTENSQYVVALTETASCYLYARNGDREEAWKDFDALIMSHFYPASSIELFPESIMKDSPSKQDSKSVYYDLPEKMPTPAIFITTDYSNKPEMFAIRYRIWFAKRKEFDELRQLALQQADAKPESK